MKWDKIYNEIMFVDNFILVKALITSYIWGATAKNKSKLLEEQGKILRLFQQWRPSVNSEILKKTRSRVLKMKTKKELDLAKKNQESD